MSTTFHTGPLVGDLGGADVSWLLGIVVAAGLYYVLTRPMVPTIEASAAHRANTSEDSDATLTR